MDVMQSWVERSSPNLVPIKSSLSIILGDAQVWSTVCVSADWFGRSGKDAEVIGQKLASRKADKLDVIGQRLAARKDAGKLDVFAQKVAVMKDADKLDVIGQKIATRKDADKLDVFAQKLAARKEDVQECEKRTKKSRQVFTCSQPPVPGIVADFTGKDIEVYESTGGQDMGLFCGMEPHLCEESAPKQACQPSATGPVSDGFTPQALGSDRSIHQSDVTASEISYPQFTLMPQEVRSECELKTCFPSPAKPNLFYSVSDSSLPILKSSSLIFSRLLSQMSVQQELRLDAGLQEDIAIPSRTIIPMYGIHPSCFSYDPPLRRSILFNPNYKDILLNWKTMDNALAKKIVQIQTANNEARRGKFLSYAKFNSSFKLSEVFYEGINSRCLSHATSLLPSFRLSGWIHKVNPDYEENQSVSEAMTLMSLSSITSVRRQSRMPRMCQLASSANSTATGHAFNWSEPNSTCADPEPTKHVEVSPSSANCGVSLAQAVTTARKQQLSKLQDFVRNTLQGGQKETDIWSSSASSCKEIKAAPKRLVDVTPSCIFQASVTERNKLPVWKLKPDKPGMNYEYKTDRVNDFVSKAYNYMRNRDRPNSHRCFFQQPTYRAVDEGVQFPDVALTWDRSSNVKEPLSDSHIPANENSGQPGRPITEDKVDRESSTVIPPEMTSSANDVPPENQNLPTNLNVVVACDKPFSSTSEFQTVSSGPVEVPKAVTESSSNNVPASSSSNKCRFSSSDYHTVSTAASLQPRHRKAAGKVQAANPKCCRNRKLPESQFCHSYRALCDKRKIKIKYENGRFTVLKEIDRSKRQTVWSIITGKATRLLNSVVRRKPRVHRASGR